MEFLLTGLAQLGDPAVFMTMCIGAILGVVVGAIPGAGAAVTIAILLPTTFSMDPLNGMTLLLGVYCGAAYGSAIPAVMINTPGSPVAVMTAIEAKPFVDRGEARRALSLAYSSSFVGGVLAVLALMLLSQPLANVAKILWIGRICDAGHRGAGSGDCGQRRATGRGDGRNGIRVVSGHRGH